MTRNQNLFPTETYTCHW